MPLCAVGVQHRVVSLWGDDFAQALQCLHLGLEAVDFGPLNVDPERLVIMLEDRGVRDVDAVDVLLGKVRSVETEYKESHRFEVEFAVLFLVDGSDFPQPFSDWRHTPYGFRVREGVNQEIFPVVDHDGLGHIHLFICRLIRCSGAVGERRGARLSPAFPIVRRTMPCRIAYSELVRLRYAFPRLLDVM